VRLTFEDGVFDCYFDYHSGAIAEEAHQYLNADGVFCLEQEEMYPWVGKEGQQAAAVEAEEQQQEAASDAAKAAGAAEAGASSPHLALSPSRPLLQALLQGLYKAC